MKTLLELGRQALIGFGSVDEEGITTCGGTIEEVQEGGSRRLLFVGHIRVPGHRVCPFLEEILCRRLCGAAMDKVNLWMTLGGTTGWVDVVTTEVAAKVQGFLDGEVGEVLAAESWMALALEEMVRTV